MKKTNDFKFFKRNPDIEVQTILTDILERFCRIEWLENNEDFVEMVCLYGQTEAEKRYIIKLVEDYFNGTENIFNQR